MKPRRQEATKPRCLAVLVRLGLSLGGLEVQHTQYRTSRHTRGLGLAGHALFFPTISLVPKTASVVGSGQNYKLITLDIMLF
jgi:hypothetical protein